MNTLRSADVSVLALALCLTCAPLAGAQEITLGIGTQNTTTNTVHTGVVLKEMGFLEKRLPKTGKYAGVTWKLDWQNFTSGPPVTNGMMANKLQLGAMGDYPLVVNGFNFTQNPESKSQLVSVAAYSISGSGNGLVVHKDSPHFKIDDLKDKTVTVPFGSAAHGMLLKTMQDRKWPQTFFKLASQTPEVGATSLQEKKIEGHANFVPFAELLPFRGFARKIFDGAQTNAPTFHGLVVRTDFAEKHPEVIVAYIKASIDGMNWVKSDPKLASEKIEQWTGIAKEVVYMFMGPMGIMNMDMTIKPQLVKHAADVAGVLQSLDRIKAFDVKAWVNESYVRQAYEELGLDYGKQLADLSNYPITGQDRICGVAVSDPTQAGQIWVKGGDIESYSSPRCTLAGYAALKKGGKEAAVVYLQEKTYGIKVFADHAFYAIGGGAKPDIVPFMLKGDAEAHAAKIKGKLGTFADAVAAASAGS